MTFFALLLLLLFVPHRHAVADDVTLSWSTVTGAQGYTVYQSADAGRSWAKVASVADPVVILHAVPGDRLVMFRVSATVNSMELVTFHKGSFYCGPWKPGTVPAPTTDASSQVLADVAALPATSRGLLRDPSTYPAEHPEGARNPTP